MRAFAGVIAALKFDPNFLLRIRKVDSPAAGQGECHLLSRSGQAGKRDLLEEHGFVIDARATGPDLAQN